MNDTPETDQDAPPAEPGGAGPDPAMIGRRVSEIKARMSGPKFELFPGARVDALDGAVLARSRQALLVKTDGRPAQLFIPKSEIMEGAVIPNAHRTIDPDFGEAQHYDVQGVGRIYENAARSFVEPPAAFARIKDCVTFDLKAIRLTQEKTSLGRGPQAGAGEALL